jgi:NADH-quinone oxidoreductase subunit J
VRLRQGSCSICGGRLVGLLLELLLVAGTWAIADTPEAGPPAATTAGLTNTEALGNVFYTEYFYLFQAAGVILLVAIIGAITLTLRDRGHVRRQDIGTQVHRDRATAVELRKVKPRAGI